MPIVALGAIAGAAAVATTAVTVSTVAMVGLAAVAVGKITKFKELEQFGSGLGLGAGIAGVASSVFGAADAAAGLSASAGTAEAGGAALENTISSADLAGIDAAAGGIGSASSAPGALEIATSWDAPATAFEVGSGVGSSASSVSSMPTGLLGSSPGVGAPAAPGLSTPPAPQVQAPVEIGNAAANSPVAPPGGTDTGTISKWWSSQPESVKNRILQMGGNFAGNLFDGWSAEEKMALQREQQNLEKQKYDTMMKNGSAQPVVQFQSYKPAGTGLLASTKG